MNKEIICNFSCRALDTENSLMHGTLIGSIYSKEYQFMLISYKSIEKYNSKYFDPDWFMENNFGDLVFHVDYTDDPLELKRKLEKCILENCDCGTFCEFKILNIS